MNETVFPLILLLVLIWPLLLAGAVAFGITRPLALRLTPWAALPALMAVVIPDTELQLADTMLGSVLLLDATGRVFLLLVSILWLATGLLVSPRLHVIGSNTFAVLLLLAMAGGFGLVLAGDALLFYASSTFAGYALYGALVHAADTAAHKAGKLLVILLVISDLLIFELLLLLGQAAGDVDFPSLSHAFLTVDNRGMLLGLLVVGFGIKIGLIGVHFWLAPILLTTGAALRPALVAFMLGAGLLGWLRLLPLGEIDAPVVGEVLRWVAWITLAYALLIGLLQARFRSLLAFVAIALGGLWLMLLGAFLQHPLLWLGVADMLAITLIQAGFALAALLLLEMAVGRRDPPWHGYFVSGVSWLAALLLATAPVGIAEVMTDQAVAMPIYWAMAVITFLVVASLVRRENGAGAEPELKGVLSGARPSSWKVMPNSRLIICVTGLTTVSASAMAYKLAGLSFAETTFAALIVLAATFVAVLSTRFLVIRLPALPLVFTNYSLALVRSYSYRLANMGLMRRFDIGTLARRLWSAVIQGDITGQLESALTRWPIALVLMLLLGLLVAWMSG